MLDTGMPPIPGGRGAQSSWQRLQKTVRDHRSALLVSTPYRSCGPAASVVVEAKRVQTKWHGRGFSPRLLETLRSRVVLGKARGRADGVMEEIRLRFESGSIAGADSVILPLLPTDLQKSLRTATALSSRVSLPSSADETRIDGRRIMGGRA